VCGGLESYKELIRNECTEPAGPGSNRERGQEQVHVEGTVTAYRYELMNWMHPHV
jgi:hypothetical protein